MTFNRFSNSTINQCKKIIDIHSPAFKTYKRKNQEIHFFIEIFTSIDLILLILTLFEPDENLITLTIFSLSITVALSVYLKRKNKLFFSTFPKEKLHEFLLPATIPLPNPRLYKTVFDQLESNKTAVRSTWKALKWFFVIIVIGTFEDKIKNFFQFTFGLQSAYGIGAFICILVMFAAVTLPVSYFIGNIINILIKIKKYLDAIIEKCIDNGMFVRNYALLTATLIVLQENN